MDHVFPKRIMKGLFGRGHRSWLACTLLILCLLFAVSAVVPSQSIAEAQAADTIALEISGDGVGKPLNFTLDELKKMDQHQYRYSTINTWPTKKWYVAEGVKLSDLLARAKIKDDAKLLKFTAKDGYSATYTVQELLKEDRYFFPRFKENDEIAGHIPGSADGAEKVEALLALLSIDSNDFADLAGRDLAALHLVFGQRALTEQSNEGFVKNVAKIEVFTEDPSRWPNPKATPAPGKVAREHWWNLVPLMMILTRYIIPWMAAGRQ